MPAYNDPHQKRAYGPNYQRDPEGYYNPTSYPPQPGFAPGQGQQGYPAGGYVGPAGYSSQSSSQQITVHQQPATQVVIVGGCPACRVRCCLMMVFFYMLYNIKSGDDKYVL